MNKRFSIFLLALCLMMTLTPTAASALDEKLPIDSSTCVYDGDGHTLGMGSVPAGADAVLYIYTDENDYEVKTPDPPYFVNAGKYPVTVKFLKADGDALSTLEQRSVTVTIEKGTQTLYFTPGNVVFQPGEKSRQLKWVHEPADIRLYFTSSDSRHFWVDPSGGLVSLNQEGGVSIWATAPESDNYKSAAAMCIVETESTLPQIDIDTKLDIDYGNAGTESLVKRVQIEGWDGNPVLYLDAKLLDTRDPLQKKELHNVRASFTVPYKEIQLNSNIPVDLPVTAYDFTILHQRINNTIKKIPFIPRADGLLIGDTTLSPFAIVCLPKSSYNLYYDVNGGTGTPMNQRVPMDSDSYDITVATDQPRRDGYIFMGWSLSRGGDVKYMPGDPIRLDRDTVLYAVWGTPELPQTGDDSRSGLWLTLMLVCAAALACRPLHRKNA